MLQSWVIAEPSKLDMTVLLGCTLILAMRSATVLSRTMLMSAPVSTVRETGVDLPAHLIVTAVVSHG